MDVILLSIEWVQKPFTLLPMHSVYHTFEYHTKKFTNAMDIVRDDVIVGPPMVSHEVLDVNHDFIINDDNIDENEGNSSPLEVDINDVTCDGLKKDQNFHVQSPQNVENTCNSPSIADQRLCISFR